MRSFGVCGLKVSLKFRPIPQFFHALARQFGQRTAFRKRDCFHPLKTRLEFAIGLLQRDLRVGAHEARHIYCGEKQVPDFFFKVR
jgi:hypothetical protein